MQIESGKHMSLREVFEAKNLALVYGYVKKTAPEKSLTMDMFLLLHKMLLTNIRDILLLAGFEKEMKWYELVLILGYHRNLFYGGCEKLWRNTSQILLLRKFIR